MLEGFMSFLIAGFGVPTARDDWSAPWRRAGGSSRQTSEKPGELVPIILLPITEHDGRKNRRKQEETKEQKTTTD
jgi:hypothetical protein